MDFIKEWSLTVCITLIIAVIFSMMTPHGNMGKMYKIILAVFIFISFLLPFRAGGIDFDLPFVDFEEVMEEQNSYNALIENMIKSKLIEAGYEGCIISCSAKYSNDEIKINSLTICVPSGTDKEDVKNYVFENAGMVAEVYGLGE